MFDLTQFVSPTTEALLAIAIVLGMFILFLRETYPAEVVAMGTAALFIAAGFLPVDVATRVLSNSAPWTIAFMFLIMGGLVRTGALEHLTRVFERGAERNPRGTIAGLFGSVVTASAFMNNTPVVAVMIPVVIQLSKKLGIAASKLLLPLSIFTVMGGMITLIGTSTNILVDGVAVKEGLEHFSIFEIAPVGIAITLAGALFVWLAGPHLLPDRTSLGSLLSDRRKMKFFTEVAIPEGSNLIGRPALEIELFKRDGVRLIDVLRGDASLRRDLAPVVIEAGDRVVLRTEVAELLGLQANKDLRLVDKLSSVQTETVEVLITPGCRMVGRSLGELRLRRRYGVYVLAAHRRNQNIGRRLDDLVVAVGDTLLLEGSAEDIARLAEDQDMVDITHPEGAPLPPQAGPGGLRRAGGRRDPVGAGRGPDPGSVVPRRHHHPRASLHRRGRGVRVRRGAAAGADLRDAGGRRGAGPVGRGRADRGYRRTRAGGPAGLGGDRGGLFSGPGDDRIPVEQRGRGDLHAHRHRTGAAAGLDPRAFAVAVMFSASVAFATPIGYQTHMMVYGPGGYRFSDYVKIGVPLDIITAIVACLLIPFFWPL